MPKVVTLRLLPLQILQKKYLVYLFRGNFLDRLSTPYKAGPVCDDCKNDCKVTDKNKGQQHVNKNSNESKTVRQKKQTNKSTKANRIKGHSRNSLEKKEDIWAEKARRKLRQRSKLRRVKSGKGRKKRPWGLSAERGSKYKGQRRRKRLFDSSTSGEALKRHRYQHHRAKNGVRSRLSKRKRLRGRRRGERTSKDDDGDDIKHPVLSAFDEEKIANLGVKKGLCTNSCPVADLWTNCAELADSWWDWICEERDKDEEGRQRFLNCQATCTCKGLIKNESQKP